MEGEVEQREGGDALAEHVLVDVRREIQVDEQRIHRGGRHRRTAVDLDRRQQLAAHLVQMPVHLLHHRLEAPEAVLELGRVGLEGGLAEGDELLGAAVLRPPAGGRLRDAAADPLRLLGAMPPQQTLGGALDGLGRQWRRSLRCGAHGRDARGLAG